MTSNDFAQSSITNVCATGTDNTDEMTSHGLQSTSQRASLRMVRVQNRD